MSEMTFYTLDEVLAAGTNLTNFKGCLANYAKVSPALDLIIANYSDWFGLWLEAGGMTEMEIIAEKINQCTRWTAWLKTKAIYWDDYLTRQSGFTGKQESVNRFLDTPETATDYTGQDTHVTNISRSETSSDNHLGLETLKPVIDLLVQDFRKTWLMPKEAI